MRWFWIDRFEEFVSGQSAVAIKNFSLGEETFHGYFPGHPVMPGSLILEGIAQTGGENLAVPNVLASGADPCGFQFASGEQACVPFYNSGELQSVALPLLIEFRCYPDDAAQGINVFDTSFAISTSDRPYFRAFSVDGINQQAQRVLVDPDLQSQANGGFNPASVPNSGAPTSGLDNQIYLGAADLVTRVSRSYSVWYQAVDADGQPVFGVHYSPQVLEPAPFEQPLGAEVQVAFRGATQINDESVAGAEVRGNALSLDAYGDHYGLDENGPVTHDSGNANLPISFLNGDDSWHEDISEIDGAAYYQLRLTFIANPTTRLRPEVSALAVAWQE